MKKIIKSMDEKKVNLCLFYLLFAVTLLAQPLKLTLVVQPPYPLQIEDYVLQKNTKAYAIVTNTSQNTLQYRLETTIEGNNGIKANLKPGYKPTQPLIIAPLETKSLNYEAIQSFYANLTAQNISFQGIDPQILAQTGMLPEGIYTICVKAFDYNTNVQLSGQGGCTTIYLTHFDPPIIIKPSENETVKATQPQFLNINWASSGVPGTTRYKVKLIDATLYNSININDLASNPAVSALFQTDNLVTTSLLYDASKPALIDGHKYVVQVTAYDPTKKLAFKNQGRSVPVVFTYKKQLLVINNPPNDNNGGGGIVNVNPNLVIKLNPKPPVFQEEGDPLECNTNACESVISPDTKTSYQMKINDEIKVGKFKMKVTNSTNNTGEGTIFVAFLKTPIKVKFANVKVNNDKQLYEGTVKAVIDNATLIDEGMSALEGEINNLDKNKAKQINEFVGDVKRKVSQMNGQTPIGLPISMDNNNYNLALVGINFTPSIAYMNAVLGVEWLESMDNDWVIFAAKGICIRPNGLGAEAKIALKSDKILKLSDKMTLKLLGGENKTYISLSCKGFDKLSISGAVEFDNSIVQPVNAEGEVIANAKLSASITVVTNNIQNWMVENASLSHAFTTPFSPNFNFKATEINFDYSDLTSPTALGATFDLLNLNGEANRKKWRGFHLKNLTCNLPNSFKNNGEAIKINVTDLMLDKNGFSGIIEPKNFNIALDKGDMSGWGFSIENFSVKFANSKIKGGGFGGSIRLPIAETGITYSCLIDQKDGEFNFSIGNNDDFEAKMWFAKFTVESSTITLAKDDNKKYFAAADINGKIEIGWDNPQTQEGEKKPNVGSFSLPKIDFDHLKLNSKSLKGISIGAIELDNKNADQGNMVAFPFKVNGLGFEKIADGNDSLVGIKLDLGVTLAATSNGISGDVGFTIFSKYNNAKKAFKFEKIKVGTIHIDAELTAAHIVGNIDIYNQDAVYGNGFRGSIAAKIKGIGIDVGVTLQVGRTLSNYTYKNQKQGAFNYFMFDAMVAKDSGWMIPGTMAAIYGIGGGGWWNMAATGQAKSMSLAAFGTKQDDSQTGKSASGVVYTPAKNSLGFKACVAFGIAKVESVINGDVGFAMYINTNSGFDSLTLDGNLYVLNSLSEDRSKASVTGNVHLKIAYIKKENADDYVEFHLAASLDATIGNGLITGKINLEMHFEPNLWYINCGKWTPGKEYNADPARNSLSIKIPLVDINPTFYCYLMMGSNVQTGLPPLPKDILNLINNDPNNPMSGNQAANQKNAQKGGILSKSGGPSPEGKGFAFGAAFALGENGLNFSFLLFYAQLKLTTGFDVLLTQYDQEITCNGNSDFGVNHWYAKGQAFAYLHAEAGVQINLWFWKGKKYPIIALDAAAVLQAELPNPNWLRGDFVMKGEVLAGLIDFNMHFQFEVGKKCIFNEAQNPFSDYPIIADVKPTADDKMEIYEDFVIATNYDYKGFELVMPEDEYDSNPNPEDMVTRHFGFKNMKFDFRASDKTKKVATADLNWAFDGKTAYVSPSAQLKPETNYYFKVTVEGWDLDKNKKIYDESYPAKDYVKIKTDKMPDNIPSAVMLSATPTMNQRFFLKDQQTKGDLTLKNGSNYCALLTYLPKKGEYNDSDYEIKTAKGYVRFTELETGKIFLEECNCSGDKFTYNLPKALKNSNMYQLELLRRWEVERFGGEGWGGGDSNGNSYGGSTNQYNYYLSTKAGKEQDAKLSNDQRKVLVKNQNRAKRSAPNVIDKVFVSYYFKTSKHNTFEEKAAKMKTTFKAARTKVYAGGLISYDEKENALNNQNDYVQIDGNNYGYKYIYLPILYLESDEPLDAYDAYGYTLNTNAINNVKVPPLFELVKPKAQWYNDYYKNNIYTYHAEIKRYITDISDKNRHFGHTPFGNEPLTSGANMSNSSVNSYNIDFYKKSKHDNSGLNMYLNGKQIVQALPPLSEGEIEKAVEKMPKPNSNNAPIVNLQANVPKTGSQMQLDLNLANQNNNVLPIIEYNRWLSFRDMDLRLTLGFEKMVTDVSKLEKGNANDKLIANQRHTLWWHYMDEQRAAPERFIPETNHKIVLRWHKNDNENKTFDYNWKKIGNDDTQNPSN